MVVGAEVVAEGVSSVGKKMIATPPVIVRDGMPPERVAVVSRRHSRLEVACHRASRPRTQELTLSRSESLSQAAPASSSLANLGADALAPSCTLPPPSFKKMTAPAHTTDSPSFMAATGYHMMPAAAAIEAHPLPSAHALASFTAVHTASVISRLSCC